MTGPLIVDRAGPVTRLTLNRPHRNNALDSELVEALSDEIGRCSADDTVLVVLAAAGASFCSGFDLTGIEDQSDGDLLLRFVRLEGLLQKIHAAPFITVAFAAGAAVGAGADLVVACEYRFATSGATFTFPGAAFGLLLGTRRLGERVGTDRARAIIRSGHRLTTSEALEIGLVSEETTVDRFHDRLAEIVALQDRLAAETLSRLHRVGRSAEDVHSMYDVVVSASRPGLRDRIVGYRSKRLSAARPGALPAS